MLSPRCRILPSLESDARSPENPRALICSAGFLFHAEVSMRTLIGGALTLLLATTFECPEYKQNLKATKSIWDVKLAESREDVKNCRRLGYVDSTDEKKGCGLIAQPTTEECLRYQVLMAGGDTLLANGVVGEAYLCSTSAPVPSGPPATPPPSESLATPTPSAAPAPLVVASPSPTPAPVPSPGPAPPEVPAATASGGVLFVQSLEAVKGCVYLREFDLRAECPVASAGSQLPCISEHAARAGGNTVLIENDRALFFSCKPGSP
jgi:hypothetical protein